MSADRDFRVKTDVLFCLNGSHHRWKECPLFQGFGSSQKVVDLETSLTGLTDLPQTWDKGGKQTFLIP